MKRKKIRKVFFITTKNKVVFNDLIERKMLNKETLDVILEKLNNRGEILIAGGCGNGKTTVLNAIYNELLKTNRRTAYVSPVSEIENEGNLYVVPKRSSIRETILLALRSNPDVLLIDEIQTYEDYRAALLAKLTGTQVIATFIAPSASEAVNRVELFDIQINEGASLLDSSLVLHIERQYREKSIHREMSLVKQ